MIFSLLYMIAACSFSALLLQLQLRQLSRLETICCSLPLGCCSASWLSLVFASFLGHFDAFTVFLVALCHALGAYKICLLLARRSCFGANCSESERVWKVFSQLFAFPSVEMVKLHWGPCLATIPVSWIAYTHALYPNGRGGVETGGNCYADLPFHLTVMNSFLYGPNSHDFSLFDMKESIFSGSSLVYPIIPDYFSATMVAFGASDRNAIMIPTISFAWAFFYMLYATSLRFTNGDRFASTVAVLLTVFCGGNLEFKEPPYWLFFVKDIFMPQRSAMFAYTSILGICCIIWTGMDLDDSSSTESSGERKQKKDEEEQQEEEEETEEEFKLNNNSNSLISKLFKRKRHVYLFVAGCYIGLLPFMQGHGYISAVIIAAFLITLDRKEFLSPFRNMKNFIDWVVDGIYCGLPAIVIALPQLSLFVNTASGGSFSGWEYMWASHMTKQSLISAALTFFWTCLGIHLYLAIAAMFVMDYKQICRYIPFWILFIITSVYKFQPWNVDNMKLFYVWYFASASSVGLLFSNLYHRSAEAARGCLAQRGSNSNSNSMGLSWKRNIAILSTTVIARLFQLFLFFTMLIMILPGIVQVKRESLKMTPLLSADDVNVGNWARSHTSPDAIFLTSSRHTHPIPTWAGRQVLVGYKGWLHSRGYSFLERTKDIRLIITGSPEAFEKIAQYKVDYVVLSFQPDTIDNSHPNRVWLNENFVRVYVDSSWAVFDCNARKKKNEENN